MFNLRVMNIHGVCSKGNVLFEGIAVCFLPMRRGLGRVAESQAVGATTLPTASSRRAKLQM